MKKFLALFVAMLLVTAATYAENGVTESAQATFDCLVIAPLTWTNPANITLEEVVAGETRDIANVVMSFALNGQGNYAVTINPHGPDPNGGVSLVGFWSTTGDVNLVSGSYPVTYTVDKIKSLNTTDHGAYSFTISLDAYYTGL
jgi:hypothetical protein